MPVDPNALFESVMSGLSTIPSGIFAALLLAGPTAVWLILRFANPRDARSRFSGAAANPHWVCVGCLSINEDRAPSCYRCSMARPDTVLPMFAPAAGVDARDVGVAMGPGMPVGPGVPVGPGMPVGPGAPAGTSPASWLGLDPAGDDAAGAGDLIDPTPEAVPALVGAAPDAPPLGEPLILEPRVKAARRRSSRSTRRN